MAAAARIVPWQTPAINQNKKILKKGGGNFYEEVSPAYICLFFTVPVRRTPDYEGDDGHSLLYC